VVLSLALLGLIALVAVASSGERPFAGGDDRARDPGTAFWDYLFSLSLAVGVIGFALLFWALVTGRGGKLPERKKQTKLAAALFLAGVVIGLALASRFADLSRLRGSEGRGMTPAPAATATDGGQRQVQPHPPEFQWVPVLLLAGAALTTAAVLSARRRARRRPFEPTTDADLVDELAALLDDTLDDLRAEPDPRRAVIAAYARMERALAAYGFARRVFEAPLEYLDRISSPLHERLPPARRLVFELTHLYERAKFSSHEIDAAMKHDAITRLEFLRDELREAA
jgi:hypothetical protein